MAEEKCKSCEVAVLGGTVLNICELEAEFTKEDKAKGVSCEALHDRFVSGDMSAKELVIEVRKRVKPDIRKQIDNIVKYAKDAGVDVDEKDE